MKKMTKIDLLSGKIEIENQPLAFQIFVILFVGMLLVVLATILKEGILIVFLKKRTIFRAIQSLFRK